MRIFVLSSLLGITSLSVASAAPQKIDLQPGEEQAVRFSLRLESDAKPLRFTLNGSGLELRPDKDGNLITAYKSEEGKLSRAGGLDLIFWPKKGSRALPGVAGLTPRSWREQEIGGLLRAGEGRLQLWLQGRLLLNEALPTDAASRFEIAPGAGATLSLSRESAKPAGNAYHPVDLSHLIKKGDATTPLTVGGIPFEVWDEGRTRLSLETAGWPEWESDPGSFTESYDGGHYIVADERLPLVQVPKADYRAAYLLAYADEDPATSNRVTLRAGRRAAGATRESQVLIMDFEGEVPRSGEKALQVIRIPFTEAFAQDIEGETLDIELTKEIRLARRSPDANRFRWRPLGLPSGVKIAAVTLERSPLQMVVKATEPGALFEKPTRAAFAITLTNITDRPQSFEVIAKTGEGGEQKVTGTVPARETFSDTIALPELSPGYYPVSITLGLNATDEPLFVKHTAIGILPADARQYRSEAPWGTWDFRGEHFTPADADIVGPVMRKLGLRYGMFNFQHEERARHGIIKGNHFRVGVPFRKFDTAAEAYRAARETHPDLLKEVLIFHENSISGGHATRIPDLFHDHPPYQLNEQEQKRFREMWDEAVAAATVIRKEHPEVKLHLGNGPIPLREEFYRQKFPKELFDTGGNENPSFSRIPETQPPDPIGNNASLWMDRQMLDAYGYGDKAVSQAHETIYPSSNPGNLSHRTQADYFIRNVLHSMAWGMPKVRPGSITDVGSSYFHSNWGAVGFMTRWPEMAPKPAALAMATLTSLLDGARYDGFVDTGSESAYLLRFVKKDGRQVLPLWVVRGQREFRLEVTGEAQGAARLISWQGAEAEVPRHEDGTLRVVATSSPAWLELPAGSSFKAVSLGVPSYPASEPEGKATLLDALESLEGWTVAKKANPLLDYYNPLTPRRLGDFAFEPVADFEGKAGLKVAARPIGKGKPTMPMYQELVREKPFPLPGKPSEIGLWVNGNSAWGRIIFELEDASGQRWVSIGAKAKGGSDWMADWLGKELAGDYKPGEIADWNTDDAWGLSRINFDGWRYLSFPLPGQYPGEGFHWPANSQWYWDKDGIVHYPLSLKKVILELPEKTLHMTRYAPAKRPEIVLRKLVAVERDMDQPKSEPRDYVEDAQVTID